jgi:choline-sulfatase
MRSKSLFKIFPFILLLFFITGFAESFSGIAEHHYLQNKMIRLFILLAQKVIFRQAVTAMAVFAATVILLLLLDYSLKRWGHKVIRPPVEKIGKNKILYLLLLSLVLTLYYSLIVQFYLSPILKNSIFRICEFSMASFFISLAFFASENKLLHLFTKKPIVLMGVLSGILLFMQMYLLMGGMDRSKSRPNVILICIDCLRPDHLNAYGYDKKITPNIDALSEKGVVFENAYSNAGWTKPSVATLLTSVHAYTHKALTLESYMSNDVLMMAEIFKNHRYKTLYLNGGNVNIHDSFGFAQGVDHYVYSKMDARVMAERFITLLPAVKGKPFFFYIHLNDAHLPYHENKYNSHLNYEPDDTIDSPGQLSVHKIRKASLSNQLTSHEKNLLTSLYDAQLQYIDESIGLMVQALKENRIFKNTIVVITSDHGEEFWDHGNYEHGHSLYEEIIHVPFIITGPDLETNHISQRVGLIDVMPTLLDLAGLSSEKYSLEGRSFSSSLLTFQQTDEDEPLFVAGTLYGEEKNCLIHGPYKLIVNTGEKDGKQRFIGNQGESEVELYNLTKDPLEQNNIKDFMPQQADLMMKQLSEYTRHQPFQNIKEIKLNKDIEKQLKSLGYF